MSVSNLIDIDDVDCLLSDIKETGLIVSKFIFSDHTSIVIEKEKKKDWNNEFIPYLIQLVNYTKSLGYVVKPTKFTRCASGLIHKDFSDMKLSENDYKIFIRVKLK